MIQLVAAGAASRLFGSAGDVVIRVVMLLSLIATINALQLMASRVPFAIAQRSVAAGGVSACKRRRNSRAGAHRQYRDRSGVHRDERVRHAVARCSRLLFIANYALVFSALFVSRRRALMPRDRFECRAIPLSQALRWPGRSPSSSAP